MELYRPYGYRNRSGYSKPINQASGCAPSNKLCQPCTEHIPMPIPEQHIKPSHKKPGMAYVPYQEWGELFDMSNALIEGTAFKELDLVFCGSRGNCR